MTQGENWVLVRVELADFGVGEVTLVPLIVLFGQLDLRRGNLVDRDSHFRWMFNHGFTFLL